MIQPFKNLRSRSGPLDTAFAARNLQKVSTTKGSSRADVGGGGGCDDIAANDDGDDCVDPVVPAAVALLRLMLLLLLLNEKAAIRPVTISRISALARTNSGSSTPMLFALVLLFVPS